MGFGKRHGREDDDESREIGMFAPPEKFSSVDWLLAALIGAAAFFAIVAFSYKGLHPTAWDDCAFAAGQCATFVSVSAMTRISSGVSQTAWT